MPESLSSDNSLTLLTDEVVRLQGRLKSLFADVHGGTGLSTMEDVVLTAVIASRQPPTVPQIGRSLGHPRQVIQRAANALMDAGLIEKAPNPHHKRATLLLATEQGLALKRDADRQALTVASKFLDSYPVGKCERLVEELRELRQAIEMFSRSAKSNY